MKGIHRFDKKTKTIFWAAALVGLVAGVIGNLFASILWEAIKSSIVNNAVGYLIFGIGIGLIFFGVLFYIFLQIEKNRPNKM